MKYDVFTGAEITEGATPQQHINKMCLNCKYMTEVMNETGEVSYHCTNEKVMEKGKEKILAALPEGFEIDTLVLKPMNLKNPTKKCGNYDFDLEFIVNQIKKEMA